MSKADQLRRFLFDKANIRGDIVQLNKVWQTMEANHQYPAVIREYLGEAVAAAVLLSATIKFEGSLTIQASGDGPLNLMVVECRSNFGVRGVAKFKAPLPEQTDIKTLLGKSKLIISIEQALTNERYQGIVALEGDSIAEFLEGYLQHSEQLETRIFLAADKQAVGGLLLQQLPGNNEDDDSWERITHLGSTIHKEELLELQAREIIHRLYHEEDVRLFDPDAVHFQCSCSRDKVSNMLRSIGEKEAAGIIKEQGAISVDCEFCGTTYEFDEIDIAEIYASINPVTASTTRH